MNIIEQINNHMTGSQFRKSYDCLRYIRLTPTERDVLEYTLSFQLDNRHCRTSYATIAARLGVKKETIKNVVKELRKKGFLKRNTTTTNYNPLKGKGGSRTELVAELSIIISRIQASEEYKWYKRELEEQQEGCTTKEIKSESETSHTEPYEEEILAERYPEYEVSEFKLEGIEPVRFLLRYTPANKKYYTLINNLEPFFRVNGNNIDTNQLAVLLNNYVKETNSEEMRLFADNLLTQILEDYRAYSGQSTE